MGLWYSKDSEFELIAYSYADHAGCNDDCKSTSGGIQFLRDKLVSWSSKKQDYFVMSDSEDFTVTYTVVSSPFGGLSDIGSPRVDGPPVMPEDPYAYVVSAFQAPPSPDFVPGPEQAPPSPVYVPYVLEPVYPKFMPPEDKVLPAEEQPLPAAVSPTADSPGYIPESDPEEDPADYPADGGDDNDDDDESSDDDEYDDEDVEEDEDEEEHPWLGYLSQLRHLHHFVSSPLPVPPPLPASPTYPLGYRAAMIRLRVESPFTSHTLPLPLPIVLPHTRAYVAMMRAAAPSTYILAPRSGMLPSEIPPSGTPPLLPIPAPTSSPSLLLPSADHGADTPEVCLPPRKRLCIAFGPRYEVGESLSAPIARPMRGFRADYGFVATMDREIRRDLERYVGYGITYTWDEMLEDMPGAPTTDDIELGRRMTNLVTTVRQDTDEIYGRLDEAQEARAVLSGRLNLLGRDKRSHAYTALLIEREARLSREAWSRSMEASDIARAEVMSLRTTVLAQQSEIAALLAANRTRQAHLAVTLRLMSTLQTQVTALQSQRGPAKDPSQPEVPEEADSSS
ncbi:hypothetical protein Tco_0595097 [Tanacetum coccineum]